MNLRPTRVASLVGLGLALALAGCSSQAARPAAPSKPAATPVPHDLATYVSLAGPLLHGSIGEATDLFRRERIILRAKHGDVTSLANDCTQAGGDLSNSQSTFSGLYRPVAAGSAYALAAQGYKLVLAGTDECGLAVDQGSRSELTASSSDLSSGLSQLSQAAAQLDKWQTTGSS